MGLSCNYKNLNFAYLPIANWAPYYNPQYLPTQYYGMPDYDQNF